MENEVGLSWPKLEYPRGTIMCDGSSCCLLRGRQKPGSGMEVARKDGDLQGEIRWFCSMDCRVSRKV